MTNLGKRVLTAVVAIPIILALCLQGGALFFVFVAAASAIALREYYRLAEAKGARPLVGAGVIFGFLVNASFYHAKLSAMLAGFFQNRGIAIPFPSQAQLLLIILLAAVAVLSVLELFRNNGSALLNLATTTFGILYISLFFGTLIGLRELFIPLDFPMLRYFSSEASFTNPSAVDTVYRWGGAMVISLFAMIWICDTAAFHIGLAIGRHKLFPRVSPNKSWEGAVAGFVCALLAAAAAKVLVLGFLTMGSALVVGAIVGIFGQIGDLAESLLKRDAGVKDSSNLIPGHGGVFDRFDSLLLVSPLVYLYIDFIVFS